MEAVCRALISTLILLATPAAAVELRPIEVRTGIDGLESMPLSVANGTISPIVCRAELAHWYSIDLVELAPGSAADIALWFDPDSGTVTVLNEKQENMPIEKLWCGLKDRAYATRAELRLDRRLSVAPGKLAVRCSERDGLLRCG